MADPLLNPFSDDIFDAVQPDFSHGDVEWINLQSLVRLKYFAVEVARDTGGKFGSGKVALITAPRAGYGKSHLIARLNRLAEDDFFSLSLRFDPDGLDSGLRWRDLLTSTLFDLDSRTDPSGNCTALDGIGRRLFADVIANLIARKKIPCGDPDEAIAALRNDPIGLFDFSDDDQVVGRWFSQYFDQLLPSVANAIARTSGISTERAKAWANRFYRYASRQDGPSGHDALAVSLPQADEPSARQSFHEFVRLASAARPLLVGVDNLDGYYRDRDAGQRLAHLLLEVSKMSPRLLLLLSVNEDLWEASFGLHIASAYEDRLTSRRIRLHGLEPTRAQQLIRNRMLQSGNTSEETDEFCDYLSLERFLSNTGSTLPNSPRAILRHAAATWEDFRSGKPAPGYGVESRQEPSEDDSGDLPPAPIPLGASGTSVGDEPDIDFEPAPDEPCPTGGEIFDKLTKDSISSAAKGLLGSDKGEGAKAKPSTAETATAKAREEEEHTSLGVELPEGNESADAEVPRLIGHSQPAAPEAGKNGASNTLTPPSPAPSPARSTGEDNAFNKLKRMLSKLRSEREEQRKEEGVQTAGQAGEGSQTPDTNESSEDTLARRTSAAVGATTTSPSRVPDQNDPRILTSFRRERELILRSNSSLPIIQGAICQLARQAGERFPVLTLDEPEIGDGATAVRWSFEDNEILFGNQPGRELTYWNKLGAFAKERSVTNSSKVKMIVFSSAEDPVDVDTVLQGKDDLIGIVDITMLDRGSLASIYAAQRLVEKKAVADNNGQVDEEDVLGKLAGELDFFWKRVTRPLPSMAEK